MFHATFTTSFGTCGIAWNDDGVIGFQLPEQTPDRTARELAKRSRSVATEAIPQWVCAVIERVQRHFDGALQDFSNTRFDWSRVTEFQQAVYRQALAIHPGTTRSYGELARALGLGPEGARAVGVALATNPWPLIVPCHRIVAASGKMTGFSAPGGVRTKTRLLVLEGAELPLE